MSSFNLSHPSLNYFRVVVERHLLDEPMGMPLHQTAPGVERRRIDWGRLTWEERLTLERLLAKACHP